MSATQQPTADDERLATILAEWHSDHMRLLEHILARSRPPKAAAALIARLRGPSSPKDDELADLMERGAVATRRPTQAERDQEAILKRGPGRPKVGKGAAAVQVSIERGLLERIDEARKDLGLTRSQLIARAVEAALDRWTPATSRKPARR